MRHEDSQVAEGDFDPQQEVVNTVIHAAGILFGIIALPILLVIATKTKYSINIFSVAIYGSCFLMTFTFSTLYHGLKKHKVKRLFKLLDRISIYFFIAGTYTPLILNYMFDQRGLTLLTIIWILVLFGILFELYLSKRFYIVSILFYLVMGWMFVLVSKHFFASMPPQVIALVMSGVLLYSLGVIFYVWQKWRYHHAIWHSFVLVASICHYLAVLETIS